MGYDLTTNFRQPFFARSISDLWERWHISLTTWFRDYIYIPMGGSRTTVSKQYRNLFATFLISGLWHGANWTFVAWGALNGIFLVISRVTYKARRAIRQGLGLDRFNGVLDPLRTVYIFLLFLAGLVFFRSPSIAEAIAVFPRIFAAPFQSLGLSSLPPPYDLTRDMWFLFLMIALLNLYDWFLSREFRFLQGRYVGAIVAAFQFWSIMVYGVFNNQEFVYFQF